MRATHILCTRAPPPAQRTPTPAAMTDLAREYAARAATFCRLAGELKKAEDRDALLAIAADYEAEAKAARRVGGGGG